MKPNNPFLIAGYHSPEFFCDREMETAAILDALRNGRNVTLIAPRRMGKTGLIRHAFYRLKEQEPDIVTLYMDIYSTQSMGDFVRLVANTVLGKLDTAPQKTLSRIGQFIRSCRPVFTFDELKGDDRCGSGRGRKYFERDIRVFRLVRETVLRCHRRISADC